MLRGPLLALAFAFAIAAAAAAFGVVYGVELLHKHYPGEPAGIVDSSLAIAANLVISAALIWVAAIVGRRD